MSNSKILLVSVLLLVGGLSMGATQAVASDYAISNDATGGDCVLLGGIWSEGTATCTSMSTIVLTDGETLTIDAGVTFVIAGLADPFLSVNAQTQFHENIEKCIAKAVAKAEKQAERERKKQEKEQKKCISKLNRCFKDNTDLVFDFNPNSSLECELLCMGDLAQGLGGDKCSSIDACVSRCEVTFELGSECI